MVLLVAVVTGAACGDASQGLGAGDDVDFCTGYYYYDNLKEPDPDDRREARTYADAFQRIIDRIDRRFEFKNQEKKKVKIAPEALGDLRIMREELLKLRTSIRDAEGDAGVRKAVHAFTGNNRFREADTRVTQYYRTTCPGSK